MHLFMAREAVDKHLQVAGAMIDPKNGAAPSCARCPASSATTPAGIRRSGCAASTARGRFGDWGELAPHLRFVDAACRKLARASFHGMALYQAKMERKQGFLFRCVDVVMELFAMAATLSRTRTLLDAGSPTRRTQHSSPTCSAGCRGARWTSCSARCGATTTRRATWWRRA